MAGDEEADDLVPDLLVRKLLTRLLVLHLQQDRDQVGAAGGVCAALVDGAEDDLVE